MAKGLFFALESETDVVEPVGEMVPEVQAEVEAGTAELNTQENDVEEMSAAIEEAEADSETLGDIQEVMADSVEEGEGLDETAAEIAEVAVEAICARLGIRSKQSVMPAMESFGSKNSRLAATKIAIESIGDTIKKIWEAIKAAAIRLWEKIKSFFIGVAKNTGALSKHLEGLKQRVQNLDDTKKPVETDLEIESLAKGFSIKKKADFTTAKAIISNSHNLLKAADSLSTEVLAKTDVVKGLISKSEITDSEFQSVMNDSTKSVISRVSQVLSTASGLGGDTGAFKTDKKTKVDYFGPFASCRGLAVYDQMKGTADNEYHSYRVSITSVDSIAATKIKALTKDQMLDLIKEALALLDAMEAYEKVQKNSEKIVAATKATSDVAIKEVAKVSEGSSAKGRIFREVASEMNGINSIVAGLGVSIPKAVFDAVKLSGDYVSASIANFGEKKK